MKGGAALAKLVGGTSAGDGTSVVSVGDNLKNMIPIRCLTWVAGYITYATKTSIGAVRLSVVKCTKKPSPGADGKANRYIYMANPKKS